MTTNFTYSNRHGEDGKSKLQLNGNLLTGDTYDARNFIKQYCGGKWDKTANGWRVDVNKMIALTEIRNQIGLDIDNSAPAQQQQAAATFTSAEYYDLITEGYGKDW